MRNMVITLNDSHLNNKEYGGSSTKFGVTYKNKDFIVKLAESGDYSVYSEYIASRFIAKLGIDVHTVYVANYNGVYTNYNDTLVCMLEDFTVVRGRLHEFHETKQSSENTPIENKGYTYRDIVNLIDKHTKLIPNLKPIMKQRFWLQFICDAILANRDRHGGNWGYIICSNGDYMPAPIYDNGNSLYPGINSRYVELLALESKTDLYNYFIDRVYKYPASIIKVYDKELKRERRTNYYEMFSDFRRTPGLKPVVESFKSRFTLKGIMLITLDVLGTLPDLPVVYKQFYIFVICLRYACIICRIPYKEAFEQVYSLAKEFKVLKYKP